MDALWQAEAAFWTGSAAEAIRRLDPGAIMIFGPVGILHGDAAIAPTISDAPRWDAVDLHDRHATETGE